MKKVIAFCLILIACLSLCACGKSEEAQRVDDLIANIGEVTRKSENKIADAEEAVKKLSEKDREALENLEILETARKEYDHIMVKNEASVVDQIIKGIGTVTLDSGEKIASARAKFNASAENV